MILRRCALALLLAGVSFSAGVYLGAALIEQVSMEAMAREFAAREAQRRTETQLLACQFPMWAERR